MARPPLPPFNEATAIEKVRLAEDGWNSRDPAKVALAYTPDSQWRNRAEFFTGRAAIEAFLTRKWTRELDYRLIKELWIFAGNRIAVRFAYEFHDDSNNWFRRVKAQTTPAPYLECEKLKNRGDEGARACYQKLAQSRDAWAKAEGLWGLGDLYGAFD